MRGAEPVGKLEKLHESDSSVASCRYYCYYSYYNPMEQEVPPPAREGGGWRAPGPPPTPDTSMQYAVNTINCSQIGCVDCQTMRQFGINIQINMVSGVEMLASPSEVILTSSGTTH